MSISTNTGLEDGHLGVDGCWNFRDAGGWALPDGRHMRRSALYRSDEPLRLTEIGRSTVEGLGLSLVVDLRQQSQFDRGRGFLSADRTAHVPLVDRVIDPDNPPSLHTASDMTDLYDAMIERSIEPLARALDLIAEHLEGGPVLVHCAYGKDRAGLVTALVQAAIGVPDDSIVVDYARSHEPARRRRASTLSAPLPDDPDTSYVPPFLFSAPAEAMAGLVTRLNERHGSLEGWAASLPVGDGTIERLRDELVV